ncbi:MAG: 50S ribosomal protein L15 [Acholeplasmatales bacterium]|jgi:large subunit ribosomal protein L15|nr:50S ribosomal protein L15 [Acholeplasmatales bacterium]
MLNQLHPTCGSKHYKKRLGRGVGSGLGKTSGKGSNGQLARSGGGPRPGFEGGQIPFFQRLPKRGFNNINRVEYTPVNVESLEIFENDSLITVERLIEVGLVKKVNDGVKILGGGELTKKLTVKAQKFSQKAKELIEKAGGSAVEVN